MRHHGFQTPRFLALLFALLLAAASTASAQPNPDGETGEEGDGGSEFDEFTFEELEADDYRELDYIGFGLGYNAGFQFLSFDTNFTGMTKSFGLPDFKPAMLSHGGGIFIGGILPIKNLRIGFYSIGGASEVVRDTAIDDINYERHLRYSEHTYSLQVDYGLFIEQVEGLMLFPGVRIGQQRSEIELSQTRSDSVFYNDLINPTDFDGTASAEATRNRYVRIIRNTLHIEPGVNIDYALNQYIMLRVSGGWTFNVGSTWRHAAGSSVSGAPTFVSGGPNVGLGLYLGLFQK